MPRGALGEQVRALMARPADASTAAMRAVVGTCRDDTRNHFVRVSAIMIPAI